MANNRTLEVIDEVLPAIFRDVRGQIPQREDHTVLARPIRRTAVPEASIHRIGMALVAPRRGPRSKIPEVVDVAPPLGPTLHRARHI